MNDILASIIATKVTRNELPQNLMDALLKRTGLQGKSEYLKLHSFGMYFVDESINEISSPPCDSNDVETLVNSSSAINRYI